ncbi:uncharacterized protein LOC132277946 [Cornus florida]|uniref:uncharacterized protein LOC132277946 n=1 Tax=Cornus florida TaxID=4283 RepID=UPI00289A89D2|nr:uncharacterized protein LOC132277946 [Cornus florida]
MKALWDELNSLTVVKPCTCGHRKGIATQQQDRAMEFLQGLHDRYSALRSQVLLMDPFPDATKIYALVRKEEKQQEIHSLSPSVNAPEATALSVNQAPINTVDISPKNQANASAHSSNWSNNSQRNNVRDNRRNGKSNLHNHGTILETRNFSRPSPSRPHQSDEQALVSPPLFTQEQYHEILAMLSSGSINPQANSAGIALAALNSAWIIDTGASNHMRSSLASFSSYSLCSTHVQLPDGSHAQVTHIGTDLSEKKMIGLGSAHGGFYYLQTPSAHLIIGTPCWETC